MSCVKRLVHFFYTEKVDCDNNKLRLRFKILDEIMINDIIHIISAVTRKKKISATISKSPFQALKKK